MADFVQTMKDWKRMCDAYDQCADCPLNDDRETCIHASRGKWPNSVDNLERRVMAWAAEHPEPMYPTWAEWLNEQGIFSASGMWDKAFKPIPADIAEKLGIQPKEAKHSANE